jgi:hypothetical protein
MNEVEKAVIGLIQETSKGRQLNDYHKRNIAVEMLVKNKLGQEKWLEKEVNKCLDHLKKARKMAKKKKYHPLVELTPQAVLYIKEKYGEKYLKLMVDCLEDPEAVPTNWAIHFCEAVNQIGFEKVQESDCAYEVVTKSDIWKNCTKARREFRKWKKALQPCPIKH